MYYYCENNFFHFTLNTCSDMFIHVVSMNLKSVGGSYCYI